MKFYILTSRRLDYLFRHHINIPKEDMVIVINSLDDDYVSQAEEYCKSENLEYHITESNGNPGRGKNSVLDLFLASDDEYMVQVDADDYITRDGYRLYKHIAELGDVDAVVLRNQRAYRNNRLVDDDVEIMFKENEPPKGRPPHPSLDWPYKQYKEHFTKYDTLHPSDIQERARKMFVCYRWMDMFMEKHEFIEKNSRPVLFSRRAASMVRFPEDIGLADDTAVYLDLKTMHFDGQLDVACHDESAVTTYIYNEFDSGQSMKNHGSSLKNSERESEEYVKRTGFIYSYIPILYDVFKTRKHTLATENLPPLEI